MGALIAKLIGGWKPLLGLAVVLALVSGFAWLQTDRLSAARATIVSQNETRELLEGRIVADAGKLEQRDALIAKQNDAVRAIVEQQAEDRAAYLEAMANANRRAAGLQAQAADILSRNIETTDELERSRAALALIVEVVGQEP